MCCEPRHSVASAWWQLAQVSLPTKLGPSGLDLLSAARPALKTRNPTLPAKTITAAIDAATQILLIECKDSLPVVLHTRDEPAFFLCFVVQLLCKRADLGSRQSERRTIGVLSLRIIVHYEHA